MLSLSFNQFTSHSGKKHKRVCSETLSLIINNISKLGTYSVNLAPHIIDGVHSIKPSIKNVLIKNSQNITLLKDTQCTSKRIAERIKNAFIQQGGKGQLILQILTVNF